MTSYINPQSLSSLLSHRLSFNFNKSPGTRDEITTNHDIEPAGGAVFRREVFETVGVFDESLARAEDTDMKLRLKKHGIPIHYYPFHEIKHHYHVLPFDTLRKCYLSGLNRASLYFKHTPNNDYGPIIRNALAQKSKGVLLAFWRARQSDSTVEFFLCFPFMLVFEAADKIGYTMGIVRHLLLRSRIADGPL